MTDNSPMPAPTSKFAYPFPIAVTTAGGGPDAREAFDPHEYHQALAQAEDGFYPIGSNGQWHGGVHFGAQTGQYLAQGDGVRCIADGEVIAWKIDEQYPTVDYSSYGPATYSTGFVLVRHRLQLPRADRDQPEGAAEPGGRGEDQQEETSLLFYSLYIHLLDEAGYSNDIAKERPGFWGEASYLVGDEANDSDRIRNPHIPEDGVGLNLRDAANAIVGFAPRGTRLRLGKRRGTSGYYAVTGLDCGIVLPARLDLANVYAYREELAPVPAEPPGTGDVIIPDDPIAIRAGDLIGHMGQYQRYSDMDPLSSSCNERELLQIDVFTTDEIESFIEQSRERAAQLSDRHKTLLLVNQGARLVPAPEGGSAPTGEHLAAGISRADGPEVAHPRVIPIKALGESVNEEDGTRWWNVEAGNSDGESVWGWVRERDHANVRLCTPWDWPGFEVVQVDNTRPDQLYANQVHRQGGAAPDEQSEIEERGSAAESGPIFQKLYELIDQDGDKRVVSNEIRLALRKPWLAQALSHLIIHHESEWSGPMDKWGTIDELIPKEREKDWKKEKERIESLLWWGEVKGQNGLPNDEPLVAYNLHTTGLVSNFVCNCRCISIDRFIDNYRARHGHFSNSIGQQLDAASEQHLRVLIEGIVSYYESQERTCFIPHIAYALATARHETLWAGIYFESRTEGGSTSYFNKYDPVLASTQAHRNRAVSMENTQEGDGYKYRGRGYPQLTWKVNYRRCGEHLNIDLINEPDLALEPGVSAGCMLYGMFSGIFTGAKITRYVNDNSKDYFNARRVINGTDRASLIEGYAELFEDILEASKC